MAWEEGEERLPIGVRAEDGSPWSDGGDEYTKTKVAPPTLACVSLVDLVAEVGLYRRMSRQELAVAAGQGLPCAPELLSLEALPSWELVLSFRFDLTGE